MKTKEITKIAKFTMLSSCCNAQMWHPTVDFQPTEHQQKHILNIWECRTCQRLYYEGTNKMKETTIKIIELTAEQKGQKPKTKKA